MTSAKILINQIHFTLPDGRSIFNNLSMCFSTRKIGLVGRNGIGKSTLLKLILGEMQPETGSIHLQGNIAYLPQKLIESSITVSRLLGLEEKFLALQRIYQGSVDEEDFNLVNEDWDLEERIKKQLALFQIEYLPLCQTLKNLSGGEITRLLLVKLFSSNADFLILDEPTNHLDIESRNLLYSAIEQWNKGLIIVSHDRSLLNLMEEIVELDNLGAHYYGGNYEDYEKDKNLQKASRIQELNEAKRLEKKVKRSIQATREKHEQRQAKGKELRKRGDQPKILLDAMKDRSTASQSALLIRHERMRDSAQEKVRVAKEQIELLEEIQVSLPATQVPNNKIILEIEDLNFSYPDSPQLLQNLNLKIRGTERMALSGKNGSGKSTLIKLILGELLPNSGKIVLGTPFINYLDQNASLLNPDQTILENFMCLNPGTNEIDAYRALAKFLFRNVSALKLVKDLSGGEILRAALACVLMSKRPPQLLILDEPTNHLDLSSLRSIESALQSYQGAMIVISHDQAFLKNIGVSNIYLMSKKNIYNAHLA